MNVLGRGPCRGFLGSASTHAVQTLGVSAGCPCVFVCRRQVRRSARKRIAWMSSESNSLPQGHEKQLKKGNAGFRVGRHTLAVETLHVGTLADQGARSVGSGRSAPGGTSRIAAQSTRFSPTPALPSSLLLHPDRFFEYPFPR